MSEVRHNELRDEQVVYAIDRQDRTFLPPADHCPLCPTPPGGEPTEIPFPAFEIAVFENRFPAFAAPRGAAEVVVYTDDHDGSFGTLAAERAEDLMWVWRERYAELGAREDVEYVLIFENRGVEVGVTLHHPHGQIYGYPFLPPVPRLELAADARLGGCAPCALLRAELEDEQRIVYENEGVVAYVPYAARWPYEVHATLREHRPSLVDCAPEELRMLADGLQTVARGYDALFDRPFPYVMVVHQAPTASMSPASSYSAPSPSGTSSPAISPSGTSYSAPSPSGTSSPAPSPSGTSSPAISPSATSPSELSTSAVTPSLAPGAAGGHLHVEFYPPLRTAEKLKYLAGSEQGAGTFISDVLPEESAASLREAIRSAA